MNRCIERSQPFHIVIHIMPLSLISFGTHLIVTLEEVAVEDGFADLSDFEGDVMVAVAVGVMHHLSHRVQRVSLQHLLQGKNRTMCIIQCNKCAVTPTRQEKIIIQCMAM